MKGRQQDLVRYEHRIIVTDNVITAAYMEPVPGGRYINYLDHLRIFKESLDEILTDDAFKRHIEDNQRMFKTNLPEVGNE